MVSRADNVLVGYLCDSDVIRRQIYGRVTDYNPAFADTIDIGPSLRDASDSLVMTATNFTGGGQVVFTINVNGAEKARVSDDLVANSSKSWAFTLQRVT
jgi:hypothetical protein